LNCVDDALRRGIEALEAGQGDPRRGLPDDVFLFVSRISRLLSPPDDARQAASDPPSPGQWRWHMRCPPDLLEAQRPYARFF